jgi:hypothetical protein
MLGKTSAISLAEISLRDIYIRNAKMFLNDDFDPLLPRQELNGRFRITGREVRVQNAQAVDKPSEIIRSCRITIKYEFNYIGSIPERLMGNLDPTAAPRIPNVSEGDVVAIISADIAADYSINSDATPTKDQILEWGKTVAVIDSWPYWRQHCHSTMLNMNLPLITMPMTAPDPTQKPVPTKSKRTKTAAAATVNSGKRVKTK